MKVRYFTNATVTIETPDTRILCDPWFTEGAYEGSWYHWPPIDYDPIDEIGPVDAIWVSHIHPDHYDPAFLRSYLTVHPGTVLLTGKPMLATVMHHDGFAPILFTDAWTGDTRLTVVESTVWDIDNIDTALVVQHGTLSVVNMNDCPCHPPDSEAIRGLCGQPALALLPYAGAGPLPQTMIGCERDELLVASGRRMQQFVEGFYDHCEALSPRWVMPFAGQYVLAGRNAALNPYRGNPPREIITDGVLPAELAEIDVGSGEVSAPIVPSSYGEADAHALTLADRPMAWDDDPTPDEHDLGGMLDRAHANATRSLVNNVGFTIQTETATYSILDESLFTLYVPAAYLAGLLTGRYHWDSAVTGSNLRMAGTTRGYERDFRVFFNRFHL